MQATAHTFALNTPAAGSTQHALRELTLGELALVGGGLPRGGWQSAVAEAPDSNAGGVEPLPRGGWSA